MNNFTRLRLAKEKNCFYTQEKIDIFIKFYLYECKSHSLFMYIENFVVLLNFFVKISTFK